MYHLKTFKPKINTEVMWKIAVRAAKSDALLVAF